MWQGTELADNKRVNICMPLLIRPIHSDINNETMNVMQALPRAEKNKIQLGDMEGRQNI
jgi:hypothetical protein